MNPITIGITERGDAGLDKKKGSKGQASSRL